MSLILDALDRSEQDRTDPANVPGVHTRHGPSAAPNDTASTRRWILLAVLVLLPVLLVLAWRLLSPPAQTVAPPSVPLAESPRDPPAVTEPVAVAVTEPSAVPEPSAAPEPSAVPEPSAAPEPSAVPEPLAPSAPAPEIAALYAERPAPAESADPPSANRAPAISGQAEPTAEPEAVAAPDSVAPGLDVDALARAAQQEMEARAVSEHPVPMISDLSQREKDTIPSVFYTAHRWNGSGSNSSVVLNGKTASQGDSVGQGIEVEEILSDSVVLDYRGLRFRLRSLNSWVNL